MSDELDDELALEPAPVIPSVRLREPLELLVMELFRTISPNGGSISAVEDARRSAYGESPFAALGSRYERHGYIATPHTATSFDPRESDTNS